MTANEIINGRDHFPGLVPLIREYLLSVEIDADTHQAIDRYMDLIAGRASGKYLTNATWMRKFVRSHPDYVQDSVVSDRINYDLTKLICEIAHGRTVQKDLIGDHQDT